VNFATLIFLIIAFGLMALYQRQREICFDEDKSTSTDYSVKVSNPPPDADPDKWHNFFEQFASKQVTFVTVALAMQRSNELSMYGEFSSKNFPLGLIWTTKRR